jgi:hypothetical protein
VKQHRLSWRWPLGLYISGVLTMAIVSFGLRLILRAALSEVILGRGG